MNLKKVTELLSQAEKELMAQVGLNELDYDDLRGLMSLAERINGISEEIEEYMYVDAGSDDDDDVDDWMR